MPQYAVNVRKCTSKNEKKYANEICKICKNMHHYAEAPCKGSLSMSPLHMQKQNYKICMKHAIYVSMIHLQNMPKYAPLPPPLLC